MKKLFQLFLILLLCSCSEKKKEPISYSETPVKTPKVFAEGIISTNDNNEFDLCFTPDGKTVYFTRRKEGEKQKIFRSDLVEGNWSEPSLCSFSTDRDETPFITPDGKTIYFGSQREIPGKPNLGNFDMNVWTMNLEDGRWSEPQPLPEPINAVQIKGEKWPSSQTNFFFTLDGKEFYYSCMYRGDKAIEAYTTKLEDGKFSKPERIDGLFDNDSLWKYSVSISPNKRYMVFNSYEAPNGLGGEDLYVSKKTENGWSKAVNMGELVNSPGEEGSGRFSPDGKYFFFTHADNLGNYEYGPWSIYFIETEYLNLESLFAKK